jgi:hypothetical protein
MKLIPRQLPSLATVVLGGFLFAQSAHASLVVSESFEYSVGSLAGQNGGTGWSGSWTAYGLGASGSVQAGSLEYEDLTVAGNKAYVTTTNGTSGYSRTLGSTFSDATTNTIYISFAFNWDEGLRFFGLQLYNGATSAVEFNKLGGQSNFGIQGGTGSAAITTDTTHFVVVRIDFNASGNDTVRLYLAPSLADGEPVTAVSTRSIASLSLDSIRLAAGYDNGTHATAAAWFDEIRIGTTFADVIPTTVPEPSSAAVLAGAAALGLVTLGRRRRR